MNSGLRRRAFTLGALLVSRLPGLDPRKSDRSIWASGAGGRSGTRIGLLTYLIAMVTAPLTRTLCRDEAAEILNRAAVARQ
jgi:hypothetical protein